MSHTGSSDRPTKGSKVADNTELLNEIRADLKEIKGDFNEMAHKLIAIETRMPSLDKVQELELKMNTLQTQFKVVWAALGAVGLVAISSVIASLFRLLAG